MDVLDKPEVRGWRTGFPRAFLQHYHAGTTAYTYRGVSCLKNPVDLALYLRLLFELQPATLIEIGAHHGGSAMFFADQCTAMGLGTQIISIDAHDRRVARDPRVRFVEADARNLWTSALADMEDLPRPWLVIEDSAHTPPVSYNVLDFFADRMLPGDVIVIEDGVLTDLGMADHYAGGPSEALKRFQAERPEVFEVMTDYADFFGPNVTYNPNGWLRRV